MTIDPIQSPPRLEVQQIREAQRSIRDYLHWTPLIHSTTLSREFGVDIHLKMESLQKTGSFKPRGAFNKLLSMSADELTAGVVGVSGGNHAQGLAYAATSLGVHATICMPATTPSNYVDATLGYGAEIDFADDIHGAFAKARELQSQGRVLVHPFDDPHVAAGQGTLGLEILHDLPGLTRIYISIGGGGLIAGIATALKSANPDIRLIGVETRGADAMAQSVAAKRIVELPEITSIARTLGAPQVSPMTFDHVLRLVDEVVVVEDDEAIDAMMFLLERTKMLVEPAASCCLAAARRQRGDLNEADQVVLLMCGGNVSVADLSRWSQMRVAPTALPESTSSSSSTE